MAESTKKPSKVFKILRIIALCMASLGALSIVLGSTLLSSPTCLAMIVPGVFVIFFSIPVFFWSFVPQFIKLGTHIRKEIEPAMIKTTKEIQQQNKEDLTDIANTRADITANAITKTAKAVKKGLTDSKVCKYCGSEIDVDSKFCNSCGAKQ